MSNIDSAPKVDKYAALTKNKKVGNVSVSKTEKTAFAPSDIVEISPMALWLRELKEMSDPPINKEKIAKAKERLASDVYKNEDVLSAVVDELMEDWGID